MQDIGKRVEQLRRYADSVEQIASVEEELYEILERLEKIRTAIDTDAQEFASSIGDPLGLFTDGKFGALHAAIGRAEDGILAVIDSQKEPDLPIDDGPGSGTAENVSPPALASVVEGETRIATDDIARARRIIAGTTSSVRERIIAALFLADKKLTGGEVCDMIGAKIGTVHAQLSLMGTTTSVVKREAVPAPGGGHRKTYGYYIAPGLTLDEAFKQSK